jgi:hypothetical protein
LVGFQFQQAARSISTQIPQKRQNWKMTAILQFWGKNSRLDPAKLAKPENKIHPEYLFISSFQTELFSELERGKS